MLCVLISSNWSQSEFSFRLITFVSGALIFKQLRIKLVSDTTIFVLGIWVAGPSWGSSLGSSDFFVNFVQLHPTSTLA